MLDGNYTYQSGDKIHKNKGKNLSKNKSTERNTKLKRKDNYHTEHFNISEFLNSKNRRCKSKDLMKRNNLHNDLYDDAFKRKSRQEKRENEAYPYKNQSVRSFLKQSNSSFSLINDQSQSARVLNKISGEKQMQKAKRLSKGNSSN